ncbi:serine hydrolase [Nonomuraea mangrovi]|uniref:Serine hydrolase n=1 Tax=Nonomuraea mangrovi TaxID=2316207 RepID=A0ABW4T059_9ACTN
MARALDVTRIRARVAELLAEYRIPSAAIGVLRDGEITDFAVGVKSISTREAATTGTVYQCGSVSKTWTALAGADLPRPQPERGRGVPCLVRPPRPSTPLKRPPRMGETGRLALERGLASISRKKDLRPV